MGKQYGRIGNSLGNPLNMFKNFRVGRKNLGTVGPETHFFFGGGGGGPMLEIQQVQPIIKSIIY